MKFMKTDQTVTVMFSDQYDWAVVQVADPDLYESLDPVFTRILGDPDMSPGVKSKLETLIYNQCKIAGLV